MLPKSFGLNTLRKIQSSFSRNGRIHSIGHRFRFSAKADAASPFRSRMNPSSNYFRSIARTGALSLTLGVLYLMRPVKKQCLLDSEPAPKKQEPHADGKSRPLSLGHQIIRTKPPDPEAGLNLDTLLSKHKDYTKLWKSSTAYQNVCNFLEREIFQNDNIDITTCMCMCLGGLSAEGFDKVFHDHAMSQLVVFESLVEQLRKRYTIRDLYIQEPLFNSLDTEFLRLRGFTILHTPESEKYVSPTTFLFMPYGPMDIIAVTLATAHPSLFLCTDTRTHGWWVGNPFNQVYEILPERLRAMTYDDSIMPIKALFQRAALEAFHDQRIMKRLPREQPVWGKASSWLGQHWVYYKPSSNHVPSPIKFRLSEEQTFTRREARRYFEGKHQLMGRYLCWRELPGSYRDGERYLGRY